MKFSFYKYKGNRQGHVIAVFAFLAVCFLTFEFITPMCRAEEKDQEESIDFTSFSLEELKQVMIISVLKKPQKLSEATSAITVITQEDIRRSGAKSIPELLRGVPGFQVAQIDSSTWAVSARGFNHRAANKLLVLMDGRSLYTPLFSGVYWNVQDTLFEDIDRIEVIRGPGATLWGANAVNGVINIITKKAEDTQGGLVTSGLGNEEKRFGAFRYGSKLGNNTYSRFYLKYFEKDDFVESSRVNEHDPRRPFGIEEKDGWDSLRGGGRIDESFSGGGLLTVQGDIYDGKDKEKILFQDPNGNFFDILDIDNNFFGGNLILRLIHPFSDTSDMALQIYFDMTKQEREFGNESKYKERFDTFDMDFQHNFSLGKLQEVIWGLGYRFISDHFEVISPDPNRPVFLLDPASRKTHLVSAFFQDEIQIVRDRLRLTAGSKFEHNDYTGFEVQPSLRMLWKPSDIQNVWASVSRAVRTPSRSEYDIVSPQGEFSPRPPPPEPGPEPGPMPRPPWTPLGADKAEDLIACELGYRIQMTNSFSLDLASFFNEYDNLIIEHDITAKAETYGIEAAINWDMLKWWRIWTSYTYLHMHIHAVDTHSFFSFKDPNFFPPPPFDVFLDKSSPKHQFVIHSSMDLYRHLELDLELRYVDNLDIYVGSYAEMDVRFGWKPTKYLEFSIVGQNLLHDHHPEFMSHGFLPFSAGEDKEVERSVYGKIICRF